MIIQIAAHNSGQSVPNSPLKFISPTVRGNPSVVVRVAVFAHMSSPHTNVKFITIQVARAPFINGSTILNKFLISPEPSIRAASNNSFGIVSKKFFRITVVPGIDHPTYARIIGRYFTPSIPMLDIILYKGMIIVSVGRS